MPLLSYSEASATTGIPANTIRDWANKNKINKQQETRNGRTMDVVDLDEVVEHSKRLSYKTETIIGHGTAVATMEAVSMPEGVKDLMEAIYNREKSLMDRLLEAEIKATQYEMLKAQYDELKTEVVELKKDRERYLKLVRKTLSMK